MIQKTTILLIFLLFSCTERNLKPNEENILIELYLQEFNKLEEGIEYYRKLGTDTKDISKLISVTTEELKEERSIKSSKEKISEYLINNLNLKTSIDETLIDSINSDIAQFVNSELTFLEELNFIKLTFEFGYWTTWSCTSFNIIENNYYQIDTIDFKPNSMNILKFSNPRLTDFKLLSNSLQAEYPNELMIETNSNNKKPMKINYSYTGQSLVTGELKTYKDSIIVNIK